MSDTVPTIKVKRDGPKGYRIINASAFDAKVHEVYEDGPAGLADMTVPALKALAEERGVDLGDATKKADIIAALELAAEAAAGTDAAA